MRCSGDSLAKAKLSYLSAGSSFIFIIQTAAEKVNKCTYFPNVVPYRSILKSELCKIYIHKQKNKG